MHRNVSIIVMNFSTGVKFYRILIRVTELGSAPIYTMRYTAKILLNMRTNSVNNKINNLLLYYVYRFTHK